MLRLVKTDLPVQDENVLESDVAQIVATAHNYMSKGGVQERNLFDPYYTPEEWELRYKQVEKYFCGSGGITCRQCVIQKCT